MSESAAEPAAAAAGAGAAAGAVAGAGAAAAPSRRPCCRCHATSLWSVWYGVAVLAGTSYLVYQAGARFLTCTRLSWRGGERPFWELNSYMALVGGTVVLLPFFLAASCFRMGNLANDGVRLGAHVSACSRDTSGAAWADTWLRRAWVHGGPTAAFLHLVTALLLLLPRLIIEAKLIDAGYLAIDRVWTSALDQLLGDASRPTLVFTPADNRSQAPPSSAASSLAAWGLPAAGDDPADARRAAEEVAQQFSSASAPCGELINYASALLVFGLQYAACFWSGNKGFGLLFSAHNVTVAAVSLAAWEGFAVLYRLHAVDAAELSGARRHLLLGTPATVALYLLTAGLLISSTSVLYTYGYHKYRLYLVRQRQRYEMDVAGSRPALGYASHCAALLLLAAAAGCQGPLLHDLALVARLGRGGGAVLCCAALVLHLLLWVLLWLLLSVKHRWTFKLRVVLGRAHLRSAEQIKLVHEVEVSQRRAAEAGSEAAAAPLLVVSAGRVAAVADPGVRQTIAELVRGHVQGRRQRWEQEEVYWHKPSLPTPQASPESEVAGWSSQRRPPQAAESKHKRGHSRQLSSSRMALPDTEVTDLRTPDLSDTEDDDLATNANQNSSHLHHGKTRDPVRGHQYASLGDTTLCDPTSPPSERSAAGTERLPHEEPSAGAHRSPGPPSAAAPLPLPLPLPLQKLTASPGRACMSLQRVPPPTVPVAPRTAAHSTLPPRLGQGPARPGQPFYCADTVVIRRQSGASPARRESALASFGTTHPAPQPSAAGVRISEPPVYRNTAGLVGSCG